MLTPFSQFGSVAVQRMLVPKEPEFLYALSKSEGADQSLIAQYGGDPTRNGEPFGELGLVLQKDAAWKDQSGSPRDPQAGNIGGSAVDIGNNPGTAGTKPIYETAQDQTPVKTTVALLTDQQLAPVVAAAKQLWINALGSEDSRVATVAAAPITVGNLPQDRLGVTFGGQVYIDSTAAGRGWFVDVTPFDNAEFSAADNTQFVASSFSPASGQMDLLTVVLHELANVLGMPELPGDGHGDLRAEMLASGVRRLPAAGEFQGTASAATLPPVLSLVLSQSVAPSIPHIETATLVPASLVIHRFEWATPILTDNYVPAAAEKRSALDSVFSQAALTDPQLDLLNRVDDNDVFRHHAVSDASVKELAEIWQEWELTDSPCS
jgi:hypothetical protein